ncbi:MAG: recombinase family protein, partial [Phenylobacterium sp.]|uniref:recombinase family protein n=1 Tax=Phenylobacterium sp. TaxID=1871053 RepID=UPI002735068E
VYDVSRWGRFQNPDQSAHYEFLCAEAGVQVEYCAEMFLNDGSLSSTILKGLKRAMAAEYSRELSSKVAAGRLGLLKQGYWQGAVAGYGLRRQMVDPQGRPGLTLNYGERKALQDHHVILVPGPAEEIAVVQRIYQLFTVVRMSREGISRLLNAEGILAEAGRPWTFHTVNAVLQNPKYRGELVANQWTGFLGAKRTRAPASYAVRKVGAFKAIVSRSMFEAAARRIAERTPIVMSRAAMISAARRIYAEHGKITLRLLGDAPDVPMGTTWLKHFGSVAAIYEAIGEPLPRPPRRQQIVRLSNEEMLRRLAQRYERIGYLTRGIVDADPALPSVSTYAHHFGSLANAYLRVGFIQMPANVRNSAVGRARLLAARIQAQSLGSPARTRQRRASGLAAGTPS